MISPVSGISVPAECARNASRALPERAHNWSRWRNLAGSERRSLVALALALPLVDIAVRSAGLKRTQAGFSWLNRKIRFRACSDDDLACAHRLAELAAIAGNHGFYSITCLRQALLVQHKLRRRGLDAQLRIGAIRNADGSLQAHAWTELEGVALGQRDLVHLPLAGADRLPP